MSNEEFLVGDAAYPLSIRMLTPFKESKHLNRKTKIVQFHTIISPLRSWKGIRYHEVQISATYFCWFWKHWEDLSDYHGWLCITQSVYDDKADEYLEDFEINSDPNECDKIVCLGSTKKDATKRRQAIVDAL